MKRKVKVKVRGCGLGSGLIKYWRKFEFEASADDSDESIFLRAKRKLKEITACDSVEIESVEVSVNHKIF